VVRATATSSQAGWSKILVTGGAGFIGFVQDQRLYERSHPPATWLGISQDTSLDVFRGFAVKCHLAGAAMTERTLPAWLKLLALPEDLPDRCAPAVSRRAARRSYERFPCD
jgi:hypothetical protein